ncbi:MAG TPA: hypothetical protein VF588_16975 [Pyrinomonadaceae bacterium]|jgi:chromosome segregation ATPase
MSEETTHHLPDGRSFEERVFARFDAIDAGLRQLNVRMDGLEARMESLETRVQRLEEESARRAVETKPIWERALAEIIAVGEKVDTLTRKVMVLGRDVLTVRADQSKLEDRMDKLEA